MSAIVPNHDPPVARTPVLGFVMPPPKPVDKTETQPMHVDASKVTFSAKTWAVLLMLAVTHTVGIMAYITNDSRAKDIRLTEHDGVFKLQSAAILANSQAISSNQAAIQKALESQVAKTDDLTKSIQSLTVEIAKMGRSTKP